MRIFLLSGLDVAKRVHELNPDAIYVCSNFIRTEMLRSATFTRNLFVTHYGVNRWNWAGRFGPSRDPHRLIYSSHPSKGFDAAREIARRLHAGDQRFRLHYFGGSKLWGAGVAEEVPPAEPCLVYGGLIDQRTLAAKYKRSAFLLQLQTRREPFGIIVVEAMAAGCLVLASPVGAFPELIEHGENGFLVDGDPSAPETLDRAAQLIAGVCQDPALLQKIRQPRPGHALRLGHHRPSLGIPPELADESEWLAQPRSRLGTMPGVRRYLPGARRRLSLHRLRLLQPACAAEVKPGGSPC